MGDSICGVYGSYFQEKIPKITDNIWKKFQIRSVILMSQMTYEKKTELIDDYFDIVLTKNPQF